MVAVALGTADADWRVSSVSAAVLGFAAVAAVWWLYFDRQADVVVRAGADELGTGASAAYLGGVALFLLSLLVTRLVTVEGPHRLGALLKLGTTAVVLGLFAVQSALTPVALAAGLAAVLTAFVYVERTLFPTA